MALTKERFFTPLPSTHHVVIGSMVIATGMIYWLDNFVKNNKQG